MVRCDKCKYGHEEHLINAKTKEVLEIWYYCSALDDTMDEECALGDYVCDLYDEKLDDNETEESSA